MQEQKNNPVLDLILDSIYIVTVVFYFRMSAKLGYSYSDVLVYTDAIFFGCAGGMVGSIYSLKRGIKVNKYLSVKAFVIYWLIFFTGMCFFA
ncbi:Uncharacterised protein [Phocoenobacter uteri]|uniref:Uncharacterized protein n=1 Tax=Phocoenobacter uteri TaxID=146806 RepID=A0A379C907_9PAST|nr:hypothetical protein [Phocoenobacter uteri]MDG6882457.1 hypothetical protein [Phocoenobacter uteri]SUB58618.1 Uncharacterised protein [Phocoenobacter uteri]